MPTPVTVARQCLSADSIRALDDAVSAARRRSHSQTTSLHFIHSLLLSSSLLLRHALSLSSSASSPRLHFKALLLSFSVSLDRLPSSPAAAAASNGGDSSPPPPISNSLMAAIKRSQSIQRRHPDSSSSVSAVRVDLRHLTLSVLDDPVISRVFSDAGFRSSDIKYAILRPPGGRLPPIFLCNLADEAEGNRRRIGEILVAGRGPVLVGARAADSARDFASCVERRAWESLPPAIEGIRIVDVSDGGGDAVLDGLVENWAAVGGPGVVVFVGDLKGFLWEAAEGVVAGLTGMLGRHRGRVWLMGHVASYETYMKFLSRFPSVNKDWDLQLLPITSLRLHSLTEPFVPSGGFSETASEMKSSLISTHHSLFRCFLCNEKYEEEASALLKGYTSIANQNYISYPSHIQGVEAINTCNGLDVEKVKEDAAILNAKVLSLQKKWNDICLHFHRSPALVAGAYQVGVEVSPHIVCLPFFMDKGRICDQMSRNGDTSPNQNGREIVYSSTVDLQRNSSDRDLSFPVELSKNEQIQTNVKSHSPSLSAASMPDDHASQCSLASVSTDLVLGNVPASCLKAEQKLNVACGNISMDLNQSFSTAAYSKSVVVNTHLPTSARMNLNGTGAPVYQQVPGYADMFGKFDPSDFKELCRSLMGKVGRQDEAICTISQTVIRCRTGKERCLGASMKGVIWFGFLGPDRVGKRRIATALAELIFGSKYNFICVDLNLQEGLAPPNKIFGCQGMNGYNVKFRGKTIVDYIASEISRQPLSVVFLENVDKADLLVQNSIYQAIKTGKISDSYGREISINNAMFITTAREIKSKASLTRTECVNFSEERILEAEEWQMQILVGSSSETRCSSANVIITSKTDFVNAQGSISSSFSNKRKLNSASLDMFKRAHVSANICLDLNLPVEELEANDADFSNNDNNFWLKEFFDLVDETVIFSPFDFDAIANKILMQISELFRSDFGSQALLEIDSKVMDHILAATWLSGDTEAPDKWVKQVLGSSFSDARQRYNISTNTVMKLVHSEDTFMEEQAIGIRLPAWIALN